VVSEGKSVMANVKWDGSRTITYMEIVESMIIMANSRKRVGSRKINARGHSKWTARNTK